MANTTIDKHRKVLLPKEVWGVGINVGKSSQRRLRIVELSSAVVGKNYRIGTSFIC